MVPWPSKPVVAGSTPAGRADSDTPRTRPERLVRGVPLREYQARWMADRRRAFLADKVCVECGSDDHLELDHVDPGQKVSHRIWSWTQERRDAEIAKCRVLCRGCHVERHSRERKPPLTHGTLYAYQKYRCRCADCRAINAATERARRSGARP